MITTIGVCGAGTMGAGIAHAALQAGLPVVLFDPVEAAREKASAAVRETFAKAVEKKKITQNNANEAVERLTLASELSSLKNCDCVIEAIIENPEAKRTLYADLENVLGESAIIASNTSSISITRLAASLRHPARFGGMHFFNPVVAMRLVEIIQGKKTSDETATVLEHLAERFGKTPVLAKDVPGFIVNRVARSFYLEAMRIVAEGGANIQETDALMRSAGFKLGPFELMDVIGVDVNFAVTQSVWEQYFREPRFAPSPMQREYVEAGLLGKKTGEGFYKYDAQGNAITS
jgi:3-hydroxybutyryl-CoA dehydrogenase